MLADSNIPYVILGTHHKLAWLSFINISPNTPGHSERRTLFHETSQEVAQKTRAALDAGLSVILCVGETLAQREAGETAKVVEEQLEPVIAALKPEDWR